MAIRLELELEDIQQDLENLPSIKPDCRIGDFGCCDGYITLALMLQLDAIDCIGIDKSNYWRLPTIEEARQYFNTETNIPAEGLTEKVRQLVNRGRWPAFQQNDILKPNGLPHDLDLAYCKMFVKNIYFGGYENLPKGRDGLAFAVNNMLDCVKQNGLFCFVEESNGYGEGDDGNLSFGQILEQVLKQVEGQEKLTLLHRRTFNRHVIGEGGTRIKKSSVGVDFGLDHLVVYHARKR